MRPIVWLYPITDYVYGVQGVIVRTYNDSESCFVSLAVHKLGAEDITSAAAISTNFSNCIVF